MVWRLNSPLNSKSINEAKVTAGIMTPVMRTSIAMAVARACQTPRSIVGDCNTIMIEAFNSKTTNSTTKSNTYRVKVGNTDKVFRAVFRCENLKMPSIDHHVSVSSKGIAQFKGPLVTYYVTVEANSSSWG